MYVCHRYLGDSLIWINRHADWWHHRESADAQGRQHAAVQSMPGATGRAAEGGTIPPSDRQVQAPAGERSGRHGGPVTVWQYVVGARPLGAIVVRMLRGYGEMLWILGCIFATEALYARTHLVALVGWLGFVGLARSLWRGPRLPVVVVLLSILPVSFVASVGANFRLFLHVLPMWVLWLAWGLGWPWHVLYERHSRTHPSA